MKKLLDLFIRIFKMIIEYIYLNFSDNKVYSDSLTQCKTYAYYNDVVKEKYKNKEVLILYIDCDCLKEFNDKFGHDKGDELISNIAVDLRSLENIYEVCRLGGDEFLVIAPINFISSVLYSWRCEFIGKYCSVGIYLKKQNETVEHAVAVADSKMYKDKNERHNAKSKKTLV